MPDDSAHQRAQDSANDLARAEADAARQAVALFEATGLIEPAPRPRPENSVSKLQPG